MTERRYAAVGSDDGDGAGGDSDAAADDFAVEIFATLLLYSYHQGSVMLTYKPLSLLQKILLKK